MKIAIVLKLCCIILSVPNASCEMKRSSTPLSVESESRRKESIDTKKEPALRIQALENCVTSLLEIKIKPLKADDCCLTKICFNNYLLNEIVHRHSQAKELLLKLCRDQFFLDKEYTLGCNLSANFLLENYTFRPTLEANKSTDGPQKIVNKSEEKIPSRSEENDDKTFVRSNNGFIASNSPITDGLQFLDVPRGNDMRIPDLRIQNEYLLFGPFSTLMGYLQPAGFPLELLRDLLEEKISLEMFIMQVLKLEMVVVGWILFWAILSICLPFAIGAQLCCRGNIRRLDEEFSTTGSTTNFYDKWTGNTLAILLHVLLVLLLCPIILILAGNEQISKSISSAEYSQEIIYEDIHTFIRNTHMQISLVTTSSTDITFEAIRKDFEDLENLLGKPYQQALAAETGIDIALESLQELKISTAKVTSLVSDILNDCTLAGKESVLLQEQLREISRELTTARQQCSLKDRALCYTLQYSGYEVVFSCENITSDMKVQHLHRLGTEDNFNISIDLAGDGFVKIDEHVASNAALKVAEMKSLLTKKRTEVFKSAHNLDELTRSLSETVADGKEAASALIQKLIGWDLLRWLGILVVAIMLILLWGLLLCGAPCGCGLTSRTIPLLLSGIFLCAIAVLPVWILGTAAFLLGGHGESLVCRPLYDKQHYGILGELLDAGGMLYPGGGFFEDFKGNESLRVKNVLRSCQRDEVSYSTFHLYNQFNINRLINYKNWDDFKFLLLNFTVGYGHIDILTPALQLNLQVLSSVSNVNLTSHRTQLSKAITKRDLGSFADQLNTVARQVSDPVVSRKIDNIAYMVRKAVQMEMQKLVEIRNRMLFKITALEVLLMPLNKQANQSLSHLKTIQFFLDNQGWQIADKTGRQFTARIESYLEDLYNHVTEKLTKQIGKCRPLWDIFYLSRHYLCQQIVDPLNGISFSCFFLILLFVIVTPVVIKLVEFYREDNNANVLTSTSHRRNIEDEITWASPASQSPEGPLAGRGREQASWVSPRRPSQHLIPTPPRPQSNISPQVQPTRFSQFVSRIGSSSTQLELVESGESPWNDIPNPPRRWM